MRYMTTALKEYEKGALPADEYRKQVLEKSKDVTFARAVTSRKGTKAHFVPKEERSKKLEKTVQAEIIAFLRSKNWWVSKNKAANLVGSADRGTLRLASTDKGVPDLVCCANGKFLAIEVKGPKLNNKVDANQRLQIDKIRLANGHAFVAHSVKCVERYLEETENLSKPTTRPNY